MKIRKRLTNHLLRVRKSGHNKVVIRQGAEVTTPHVEYICPLYGVLFLRLNWCTILLLHLNKM